jgi:hypothetical protein
MIAKNRKPSSVFGSDMFLVENDFGRYSIEATEARNRPVPASGNPHD